MTWPCMDAVDQIADRAADDQREADARDDLPGAVRLAR